MAGAGCNRVEQPIPRTLDGLPVKTGVVMMVTMMAVVLHDHHDLSPRRIRQCKAEKEN
jgi:hypothetical protein